MSELDTLPHRIRIKITPNILTGCWEWIAYKNKNGYGCVRYEGEVRYAHIVVYEILIGPFPPGMESCHKCDNPGCVRPSDDHMRPGTHTFNMGESSERKRYKRKGEDNARHKITMSDAREIREKYAQGFTQTQLANIYGINQTGVSRIVRGVGWLDVDS